MTQPQAYYAPRRHRGPSHWVEWVATIVLLLLAFTHFVVQPLVESAFRGALSVVGSLAQGIAEVVQQSYDTACTSVERSPRVAAMFGTPVECAPLEQTTWLDAHDRDEIEFTFAVSGPQGSGEAHVVAVPTETGLEPLRMIVSGPQGAVLLTPPW